MVDDGAADNGAGALVDALRELGVELAFGLPGVHNLAVWEACAEAGIRLVGVRHEQAAAYAADGYARATGRLGVAVVTTGPGAANTLGATGEAMTSGAPVLVIATDIPSTLRRPGVYRGVLHETRDQAAMFAPVTKAATTTAAAADLYADVLRAGREALRAPTGPVYLGVPTDLLSAPVTERTPAPAGPAGLPEPDLDAAIALIERAERPLLWVGGGAVRAGAGDAVGLLAERLAAPVVTTYHGRGILPPDHPCLAPALTHVPAIGALWDEADLVIAIGSDLDGMTTQNWRMPQPPALLAINVDAADAAKNYRPDHVLTGDARAVTERLAAAVPQRDGLDVLAVQTGSMRTHVTTLVREEEPQAALLLDTFDRLLPADATVLADMCIAGYWVAGFHRVPAPRRLAYPMGWGTLGFAFPAALGAALRGRAVAVVGDGGFLFACGELATAVQEALPVTIVLVDDGGYGMLRFDQVQAGVPTRGVDLVTPDFVALAGAFGVPAEAVDGFGDAFEAALAKSLATEGPSLVAVRAALTPPPSTSPRWYRAAR
ncbi:acetolactate synthase-1/2/3 large subunit [Pseudonocardia hierapolitana]|uniref:Acetolactate synthase-1/2/3 large subunit n=1 Tax=Pseudonocardia hierapolitana TaxID=1128676 RepID=A0A561SQL5_9PSEU|nr:thiamine pyrophosphate-binding protein [Pseudonocardia hierapolitana]TWF77164.1 acetolactate synthase-1/2/3 large subunit [Pseudonocardia hierapolitana]